MNAIHIIPGIDDPTCGIAVAAKQLIARGVGEDGEVWVHSMWTPLVVKASVKALLRGKKLVRMPHGCTAPEKLRYHWHKKRWIAPIERWLFRQADRIVATCEEEENWIKTFEPRVKRVEIVRLGRLNAEVQMRKDLSSSGSSESLSCRIKDKRPGGVPLLQLLYVGRLHPLKGVEYLLAALKELQPSLGSLCLRIIGRDDGEGEKLRHIAADYGLNVEFCGVVSDKEKEAAYQWCDVLVLPTLSENFGLVVAEALERGKHVITTDGAPAWGDGNTYGGRLIYLKGFRNGSRETKVNLLKAAIMSFG